MIPAEFRDGQACVPENSGPRSLAGFKLKLQHLNFDNCLVDQKLSKARPRLLPPPKCIGVVYYYLKLQPET